MRIVVDTNIWDNAFLGENGRELQDQCRKIVFSFVDCSDYFMVFNRYETGESFYIEKEYRKKLSKIRDFEITIKRLYEKEKIVFVVPVRDGFISNKLIELGFHELEDHIFVFSALSADRIIITEDSDYGVHGEKEKVGLYRYLTGDLKMSIFSCFDVNYPEN